MERLRCLPWHGNSCLSGYLDKLVLLPPGAQVEVYGGLLHHFEGFGQALQPSSGLGPPRISGRGFERLLHLQQRIQAEAVGLPGVPVPQQLVHLRAQILIFAHQAGASLQNLLLQTVTVGVHQIYGFP